MLPLCEHWRHQQQQLDHLAQAVTEIMMHLRLQKAPVPSPLEMTQTAGGHEPCLTTGAIHRGDGGVPELPART